MEINVSSSVSGGVPARRTKELLRRAAKILGEIRARPPRPQKKEVSVLFCGDARMRSLNKRYRRKDRSTDVLAFPGAGTVLGDIVISVPYARREARQRGEPLGGEIDRLLLHGYLHLRGYDHQTDNGEMDLLESRLRRGLGIAEGGRP